MSDKQARYSHTKIIENHDARIILYWRNCPSDILYRFAYPDPYTGKGDWAEEYFVIYPDGISVRKVVMWSSNLEDWHSWSESLPVMQPGQKPEDLLNENGIISLANMAGDSYTYKWPEENHEKYSYRWPVEEHEYSSKVPHANIQVVNYKSRFKPFLVFTADNPRIWLAPYRKRVAGEEPEGMSMPLGSKFWWWNHWPVAQLPNDGRIAEFPDRPSHSFTSIHDSDPYETTEKSMTKIQLYGLTEKDAEGLVPLARSWNNAPELKLASQSFKSYGYDQSQRSYVLKCKDEGNPARLDFELAASDKSPVVNPVFVIKDWGNARARLKINRKTVKRGKDFRFGHQYRLESSDLVVWIRTESIKPISISLSPVSK